jgi:hypothetical protein
VPTLRTLAPGLTVLALMLFALPAISSGQLVKRPSSATRVAKPADATAAARRRFLNMFVRANFPGRSGQLFIVPREGEVLTRPDPDVASMHGSPWP